MLLLTATFLLSGCGGIGSSNLNPFNWFGNSGPEEVLPENTVVVRDPRPLIQQVTDVAVERVPGGAILRARGAAPVAGWFAADLVLDPAQSRDGVLTFGFRAAPPDVPARGTGNARLITAATYLSDGDLQGVREIRVRGRSNIRATRP